jgi:hypothetical protein
MRERERERDRENECERNEREMRKYNDFGKLRERWREGVRVRESVSVLTCENSGERNAPFKESPFCKCVCVCVCVCV